MNAMEPFISFLLENFCTCLVFRNLYQDTGWDRRRMFSVLLLFGMTWPLYLSGFFPVNSFLRFMYRWIASFVYIRICYEKDYIQSCYFALIYASILAALQSIRPLVNQAIPQMWVSLLLYILLELTVFYIISRAIPFEKCQSVSLPQIFAISVIGFLILYSKMTVGVLLTHYAPLPSEIAIYPFVVLLLSVSAITALARLFIIHQEQRKKEMIELSRNYQFENLRARLNAQEDVRRVYHDMKNHLLAIQAMSSEKQKQYVEGILEETDTYGMLFHTGNETLDGLLLSKLQEFKEKEIQLSVNLDLSDISYIESIDICAVFGNLLDNAIEASVKLPDPEERFIELKSGSFADQLVIRMINTFPEGSLQLVNGFPSGTTKEDKIHHGIGLSSVRRSLKKYGGELSFRVIEDSRLIATVTLPKHWAC